MTYTLGEVLDDAAAVFSFVRGELPRERAHDYLERRGVRGVRDAAMLMAVSDMVRRAHALGIAEGRAAACPPRGSQVDSPTHYTTGAVETIDKIAAVVDGLPPMAAALLANVVKYCDRAGLKGDASQDLAKANNYAHRLVTGEWRAARGKEKR